MRGKVNEKPVHFLFQGITPACAGKSVASTWGNALTRDHPRVCGEKLIQTAAGLAAWGSPPRVRGKESKPAKRWESVRITPACAGKRRRTGCGQCRAGDHPRVCGEKMAMHPSARKLPGSPPRVRGKARSLRKKPLQGRITPACAGKRCIAHRPAPSLQDHPRVCGEKPRPQPMPLLPLGSPPRVRGKGLFGPAGSKARGITPACAGKSKARMKNDPSGKDHPRVCGEKLY